MTKAKGMKFEMSRVAFVELFKAMELGIANGAFIPPDFALRDFVERNRKKYSEVSVSFDEVIKFPQGTTVKFKNFNNSRFSNNKYVVIRAKKKPNGKREYWLILAENLRYYQDGTKITTPDYKVCKNNLEEGDPLSLIEKNKLSKLKLPKPF